MTAYSDIVTTHGSVCQPNSIKNWMRDIDSAMRSIESSSPKQTKTHESTDKAPPKDSEFDGLLRRYQALQNDIEAVENEIVKVYYERLHDESAAHLTSSQSHSSSSTGQSSPGCGLIDAIQDPRHKDSQLTINSLVDLHFGEPDEPSKASRDSSKRRKHRKPLSEEEKGRNINKVFMRQNGF
ncbi:Ff.00g015040.m01.CDS01 [Fusarium sp. VM40]|nr:Ff.00g015040.m01.CDS01 [Fusarium sp. VM40]